MYKSTNALNIIFHILIVETVNSKKYSEDQPVKYLH